MHASLFTKMDSSTEVNGRYDNTYYGVVVASPPCFNFQGDFLCSCVCVVREVSLTSAVVDVAISLLQKSSTPATTFVLRVSRENKAPITPRDKLQLLSLEGHLLPTSLFHAFSQSGTIIDVSLPPVNLEKREAALLISGPST